jgi:SAM-dependent methyltransferase
VDSILPPNMQSSRYDVDLRTHFKLEFNSWFHRRIYRRFRPFRPKHEYANIGCGPRIFQIADNLDFPVLRTKRVKYEGMDLRYPLTIPASSYLGIFCEHTLEHLSPKHAESLLKECYRVLKHGGTLRIVVPSLDYYRRINYSEQNDSGFSSAVEAFFNLAQNWGHRSIWDFEFISSMLDNIGFEDITLSDCAKGHKVLRTFDQPERALGSLYVEAVKG